MKRILYFSGLLILIIILEACAPSAGIRQPARERSLIPVIKVLITDSHFLHVKFFGDFLLNAPEARYTVNKDMGSFWMSYENGMLSINSTRRKWHFRSGFPIAIIPREKDGYFEIDGKNAVVLGAGGAARRGPPPRVPSLSCPSRQESGVLGY